MNRFSSYKLLAKMGQGGMAEVYKAEKSGPDGFTKTVALKKILPFYSDQEKFIKMLSTEARIHSYLNHPNIVQILDFFEENHQYCMVLEYVDGKNLREVMAACHEKKIRMSWQACVYITLEILKALSYAHEKSGPQGPLQIIHRDVSPHNILISSHGEVKLSDFGIARAKIERDETSSGILKGKYRYLSPEQILTEPLYPSSDLFSLGITLYEMLSSQHPFGEAKEYQTLQKIVDQPHIPLSTIAPHIKHELQDIVEKALQKNPTERFSSAKDFYEELLDVQDPSWATHGAELLMSFMQELMPLLREEKPIAHTSPFQKQVSRHRRIFGKYFYAALGLTLICGTAFWSIVSKKNSAPLKTTANLEVPILTPSPAPQSKPIVASKPTGKLEIVGPNETHIYINGKNMGSLPLPTFSLPVGSYTLLMQHETLGKKIKSTSVAKNETTKVSWE